MTDWLPRFKGLGLLNEQPENVFGGFLNAAPPATSLVPYSSPLSLGALSALDRASTSAVGNAVSALPPSPSIWDLLPPPPPRPPTTGPGPLTASPVALPEVKRKVYFAFDFDDLLRVNNVRQIGKIEPREARARSRTEASGKAVTSRTKRISKI